jgi:cellulose synthase/poly-beta-1,6-N-acetylglucosamine synthase-like glycosyltransferase
MVLITILVTVVSIVLLAQALWSIYLTLYSWEHPSRLEASRGPREFLDPRLCFTVLLPARHEEAVIGETIRRICAANYPPGQVETIVVCHSADTATVAEARRAIDALGGRDVRVEEFTDGPINKARSLNIGFRRSSNQVVTVFDAEDDIHPDMFNIVNTIMQQEEVGVVQGGVQLMNARDHWFSIHNCLEYFFWFKSNLHLHAHLGMIPLGGNTVFVRRDLLERVGGWSEDCLTEDADLGLRLSALGERIRVVYDARHVTREETPHSTVSFVRQRTRWHQGFLQILRRRVWKLLPTRGQRALAVYTFSRPIFERLLTIWMPLTCAQLLWLRLPLPLAILSTLPMYAFVFQFLITAAGAGLFSLEYDLRLSMLVVGRMALTYFPFQSLLGVSAARALSREIRGIGHWEKTDHAGAHRVHPRQLAITHAHEDAIRTLEVSGR